MGSLAFERPVAALVDDEQLRFAVEEHPTREDALALAVDEVGEERRRRGEEHGVAGLDDGAAEGNRQVRLADAGRRWSTAWLHTTLGLFADYRVRYLVRA